MGQFIFIQYTSYFTRFFNSSLSLRRHPPQHRSVKTTTKLETLVFVRQTIIYFAFVKTTLLAHTEKGHQSTAQTASSPRTIPTQLEFFVQNDKGSFAKGMFPRTHRTGGSRRSRPAGRRTTTDRELITTGCWRNLSTPTNSVPRGSSSTQVGKDVTVA